MSPRRGNPAADLRWGRAAAVGCDCRVLEPTDVAGAVKLYGGRARPVGSVSRTARSCRRRRRRSTRALGSSPRAVSRRRTSAGTLHRPPPCGTCSSTAGRAPARRSRLSRPERRRGPPIPAEQDRVTLAYLPPRTGARTLLDVDHLDPGTSCYSVWTIGPAHRYTRAANAVVQIGPRPGSRAGSGSRRRLRRAGNHRQPDRARGDGALPAPASPWPLPCASRGFVGRVPDGRDHDQRRGSSASRRRRRETSQSRTAADRRGLVVLCSPDPDRRSRPRARTGAGRGAPPTP